MVDGPRSAFPRQWRAPPAPAGAVPGQESRCCGGPSMETRFPDMVSEVLSWPSWLSQQVFQHQPGRLSDHTGAALTQNRQHCPPQERFYSGVQGVKQIHHCCQRCYWNDSRYCHQLEAKHAWPTADRMATLHAHVGEWLLNLLALDRLCAPPIYRKPGYCRQTHKRHGARSPPSYSCSWLAQHHIPGTRHVTCVSHSQAYLAYRINNNQQQKQPD